MKMKMTSVLVMLMLMLVVLCSSTMTSMASSSVDSPFIIAHKKVSITRLKSGSDKISVSIDIYNQGSATAYDVTLTDDSWSSDVFDLVSGKTSTSFERLDA
ncbi:hypothetical protein AQUCO_02100022v1 [Aquilegia coerulea]|nr:hypothetical protein AQUCO_02100022v1 [Aquilegia coerulea]